MEDGTRTLKSAGEGMCGKHLSGSKCVDLWVRWSAKSKTWKLPFPFLYVLLFEEGVTVDMKVACPQDPTSMKKSSRRRSEKR